VHGCAPDLSSVALFPLPGVVLFPRAILPLHIFEQRYRAMVGDALAGDRMIAMALLKPGWESRYEDAPDVEEVVCLGRIVSHERLDEGKFNLLLQGLSRCRIISERRGVYRRAHLQPLAETRVMEIDLDNDRHRLTCILNDGASRALPVIRHFRRLLSGPAPTAVVADLLAFHLLDDAALKQSLLAEVDVAKRVGRLVRALDVLCPQLEHLAARCGTLPGLA
jgi:Lon protease-like protein